MKAGRISLQFKRFFTKLVKSGERRHFSEQYYKSAYPDVVAAGVDPFLHYMTNGWQEGRNPSSEFHTLFYRDAHLKGAFCNPLSHFVEARAKHDRSTALPVANELLNLQRSVILPHFNADFYMMHVQDLGGQDPIGHYLKVGWQEGRSPAPGFDASRYVREHEFVKQLGVTPFYHFISQNRLMRLKKLAGVAVKKELAEQIEPSVLQEIAANFDSDYYLEKNEDVRQSNTDPLYHFLQYGWVEGRSPNRLFDMRFYAADNADLDFSSKNPFVHYLTVGREAGLRPNPVGTRLYPMLEAPSDEAWSALAPATDAGSEYVIIMPVYKGYDETLASIYAVLSCKQSTSFLLHVINDSSPDKHLNLALDRISKLGLFSYEVNPKNIGFVKTVNEGLRRFAIKEVVLLNADTQVFGDWLDRIKFHAEADRSISTITPYSNNATICSYPKSNENNLVRPEVGGCDLDKLAALANKGRSSDIPTGVGFCLYVSKRSRDKVGILDEDAFGRGYGEENDFCMRAAKCGFRNVLAEDIFVYHAGQVSFSAFAAEEYGPGQKALIAKHPDYGVRIKQYFEADPGIWGRVRLDLMRLARAIGPDSIIYVYHSQSGGVVTHVKQMQERLLAENIKIVHMRVGVDAPWNVLVDSVLSNGPHCPSLSPMAFKQVRPILMDFLKWLSPKAIHVHSLVGFDWASTVGMLEVIKTSGLPYYFTLHDYSVVCHRNDLVLTNSTYCGLPDVSVCQVCVASDRTYPEAIDPVIRRSAYADFLAGARAVFAPSNDIKKRLELSGAKYDIVVRPHEETSDLSRSKTPLRSSQIDVVVMGAIGPHKGSRLLLSLARDVLIRKLPIRYHIVGYSDITEEMAGVGVCESGRFKTETEAVYLIDQINPSFCFFPSIWPETFCYALSVAFRLGIPPIVFDIGAQNDRVLEEGFGHILPYSMVENIQALNDAIVDIDCKARPRYSRPAASGYLSIAKDYYQIEAAHGSSGSDVA